MIRLASIFSVVHLGPTLGFHPTIQLVQQANFQSEPYQGGGCLPQVIGIFLH